MAWAKVATKVACIWLRNATEVRAHSNANEPLWLLAALCISGWLSHGWCNDVILLAGCDHFRGALANEDWLAAPLHDEVLPHLDWPKVNLHDACCKHILRWPQGEEELSSDGPNQSSCNNSAGSRHEVHPWPTISMTNG
jgi:hypothetical protein